MNRAARRRNARTSRKTRPAPQPVPHQPAPHTCPAHPLPATVAQLVPQLVAPHWHLRLVGWLPHSADDLTVLEAEVAGRALFTDAAAAEAACTAALDALERLLGMELRAVAEACGGPDLEGCMATILRWTCGADGEVRNEWLEVAPIVAIDGTWFTVSEPRACPWVVAA